MSQKNLDLVKSFVKAQESLVTQQSDFSLSSIREMVDTGSVDISPAYQRRDRWNKDKQSKLIESFILNVPIPPIYLSEDDYGEYSVIDGKQRITAISNFMENKLKLSGLDNLKQLNGMSFEDLPKEINNALKIRPYVRAIILLRQSNPELKFEVFVRLNTGGESLKPQEIRNVAYSGILNNALMELSRSKVLREGLKITTDTSPAYRNMDDIEHVLRYFTLKDNWQNMKGAISKEMDEFMKVNRKCSQDHVDTLKYDFERSITYCKNIFGDKVFNKPIKKGWRDQLISPLYDAQMVAVSMYNNDELDILSGKTPEALDCVVSLYESDEFIKAVSQATNTPSSIKSRIELMKSALDSIL